MNKCVVSTEWMDTREYPPADPPVISIHSYPSFSIPIPFFFLPKLCIEYDYHPTCKPSPSLTSPRALVWGSPQRITNITCNQMREGVSARVYPFGMCVFPPSLQWEGFTKFPEINAYFASPAWVCEGHLHHGCVESAENDWMLLWVGVWDAVVRLIRLVWAYCRLSFDLVHSDYSGWLCRLILLKTTSTIIPSLSLTTTTTITTHSGKW